MKNGVAEIKEIQDITTYLSTENKKYVIAVANALLFSQGVDNQFCKCQKLSKQSIQHKKEMPGQMSMQNLM
jgi:hypothetical protein